MRSGEGATTMKDHSEPFCAADELDSIKQQRAVSRRRRTRRSRLMKYRVELVELRITGASLADLRLWLRRQRVCVATSTIGRFLKKLPELSGT